MTSAISTVSTPRPATRTGATLWLTGLPSAGKTTLAHTAAARFAGTRAVEVLDGDELRAVLAPELGFSRADRDTNVLRIGWLAARLARHGVLVIAAVVSPYADARDQVRALHAAVGADFYEIHVATSLAVCARRDVKGLYARQRTGALTGLTGVDADYEAPTNPDLRVDAGERSVADVVDDLLGLLDARVRP